MIGRTNAGNDGGGILLKVVGGTTQPVNPRENTVWVNTDAENPPYIVSYSAPITPKEGLVWICIGQHKHNISVPMHRGSIPLMHAQIYTNGAWKYCTMHVFQGEEWLEAFTDWCQIASEGGIQTIRDSGTGEASFRRKSSSQDISILATTENTKVSVTGQVRYNVIVPIDLSPYAALTYHASSVVSNNTLNGGVCKIFLGKRAPTSVADENKYGGTLVTLNGIRSKNCTIDVSDINDIAYLGISLTAPITSPGTLTVILSNIFLR